MASQQSIEAVRRGREIYEQKSLSSLEATNLHDFIAIDLDSGDYFIGKTLSEAIQAARATYPDRLPVALRIGHRTTVDLGVLH